MAGRISQDTINSIHNNADIVSVVGEYTKLTRKGGNDWWGCCPFHSEKTGSFHVDNDKKFYYCFGCHASGDVIKFVMEMEKVTYVEAIDTLAKKFAIPIRYEDGPAPEVVKKDNKNEEYIELYERTASMFHYFLMETEQGKFALDYITKRGLTIETLEKFKIGYAPADRRWLKGFLRKKNFSDDFLKDSGLFSKNYPDISFFSDRLMFPIFNRNGKVVAFGGRILHPQGDDDRKYLNSPELAHYKKRETFFAFNFAKQSIRTHKKVIFCEGFMDCIAYHQCGIDYAVATCGTALTDEQINLINNFVDTVLLSFDSDGAGQNATMKAILMCRRKNISVKVIQLKGGKDPAEIMLNFGKENLTAQVNNAILDSEYLLNKLGEKYPIDTPEGKTKAALEFFDYIDALQSDIQKDSCLDQLGQAFNLKPEAVKRDFLNRQQARERVTTIRPNNKQEVKNAQITLNAELSGVIAAVAYPDQFKILRSKLNENDFKDPDAKRLFRLLETCFNKQAFSIPDILSNCDDPALVQVITGVISSGVYKDDNVGAVINDTINFIKRNQLEEQRNNLTKRIREYIVVTEDDKNQLSKLLELKVELDRQVQSLSK